MPLPKPNLKFTAFLQRPAALVRRWFGLTEDWHKHWDFVKNNYDLGLAHLEQGNAADAVFRFTMVSWLAPQDANVWYQLGRAYWTYDKPQKSIQALKKALQLDPEHVDAKIALEEVQKRMGG